MNIIFTYNVRHVKPDINNPQYIKEAEFDEPSTIEGIHQALKQLGHQIYIVEADENAYPKLAKLKNKADLVFNIAEGAYGRDREAQIPAILEALQIPYTGPRPLSYALGLDKIKAKEIMAYHGIATPDWVEVSNIHCLNSKIIKKYPVIAKPASEGSSKGIRASNLAFDFPGLKRVASRLLREFGQRVLVEEFLNGREFTVALIGQPPRVLPIIEITFDELPSDMPKFDHYEAKWIYDDPARKADPLICPAKIGKKLENEIEEICLNAFRVLEMADWARIDLRLNDKGKPSIIEINCPPGIIPDPKQNSRFPLAARAGGLNYNNMIKTILKSACKRYRIKYY